MAFQLDIGRISETDTKYIVDPMTMYRARERVPHPSPLFWRPRRPHIYRQINHKERRACGGGGEA